MPLYERRRGRRVDRWAIERRGSGVFTRSGPKGGKGRHSYKLLGTEAGAEAHVERMVAAKLSEGFVLLDAGVGVEEAFPQKERTSMAPREAEGRLDAKLHRLEAPCLHDLLSVFVAVNGTRLSCRDDGWFLSGRAVPGDDGSGELRSIISIGRQYEEHRGGLGRVGCYGVVSKVDTDEDGHFRVDGGLRKFAAEVKHSRLFQRYAEEPLARCGAFLEELD